MPVLLARRKPHDVTGSDFLNRAAFALCPTETGRDDQRLAERMRVPRGPRAGLEGDLRTAYARGIRRTEQRIDPDDSGEPVSRALARRLRPATGDLHGCL